MTIRRAFPSLGELDLKIKKPRDASRGVLTSYG